MAYYFFAQNRRIKKTLKSITDERRALGQEKTKMDVQSLVTQYYAIGAMKLNIMETLNRLKASGQSFEFEQLENTYRALIQEASKYNMKYDAFGEVQEKAVIDKVSLMDMDHSLCDFYLNYGMRLMEEGELTKAIQVLKLGHNHTDLGQDLDLMLGRCHHKLMNQVKGSKTKEELLKRATLFYAEAGDLSEYDRAVLLIDRGLINEGIYHLKMIETDEARLKLANVYLDLSDYLSANDVLKSIKDQSSEDFKAYFLESLIQRREYALAYDFIEYGTPESQLKLHMLFGNAKAVEAIIEDQGPMGLYDDHVLFERLIKRDDAEILDILTLNDQSMWLFGKVAYEFGDLIGLTKMLYLHLSGESKIFYVDEIYIAMIHSLKRTYRKTDTLDVKYENLMEDYEGFRLETVNNQMMLKAFGILKDTFQLIVKMDENVKNTYKDISVDLKLFMKQFEKPAIKREVHQLLGYYDQANEIISNDLKDNDHYEGYLMRGINYQALKEYDFALLDFKTAWERNRDPEIQYFKAVNYYEAYRQYHSERFKNVPGLGSIDPLEGLLIQTKESNMRKALKTLDDIEGSGYVEAAVLYGEIAIELANTYIRANSDDDLKQVYTFFIKELPPVILDHIKALFDQSVLYYEKMLMDEFLYFKNTYPRSEEIKGKIIEQFELFKTLNVNVDETKVKYLMRL